MSKYWVCIFPQKPATDQFPDAKMVLSQVIDDKYIGSLEFQGEVSAEHVKSMFKGVAGIKVAAAAIGEDTKPRPRAFRKVDVELVIGADDVDKIQIALDRHPNAYMIRSSQLRWWDGYNSEDTIIVVGYDSDNLTELKQLMTGHQLRLETKDSFTYANWTNIVVVTDSEWKHLLALSKDLIYIVAAGDGKAPISLSEHSAVDLNKPLPPPRPLVRPVSELQDYWHHTIVGPSFGNDSHTACPR